MPVNDLLINIDVDDLDRAERFYTHAFGLRVGRRLGPGVVELLGRASPIYLLAKPPGSAASADPCGHKDAVRDYRRHWTPVHLDLVVDDVDAAVARALEAGATQEQPVQSQAFGRLALMADPFGHGFCLVQFTGRGYDALVDAAEGDGDQPRPNRAR